MFYFNKNIDELKKQEINLQKILDDDSEINKINSNIKEILQLIGIFDPIKGISSKTKELFFSNNKDLNFFNFISLNLYINKKIESHNLNYKNEIVHQIDLIQLLTNKLIKETKYKSIENDFNYKDINRIIKHDKSFPDKFDNFILSLKKELTLKICKSEREITHWYSFFKYYKYIEHYLQLEKETFFKIKDISHSNIFYFKDNDEYLFHDLNNPLSITNAKPEEIFIKDTIKFIRIFNVYIQILKITKNQQYAQIFFTPCYDQLVLLSQRISIL